MKEKGTYRSRESAETLAVEALSWIAGEPEQLERFLALAGIGPATLRKAASDPAFLAGVLDFLLGHEPTVLAFAEARRIAPSEIAEARRALGINV
ncbi:MAG: DUF3572 domain-containing protein [Rhizobiales bacterium]|nr:DUF3572 domain-containing protein [Hyphomicrobiales bacterium]MBN9011295.1 DUF3572 domain-containing protein [Hyphomicrobiales bacterium]